MRGTLRTCWYQRMPLASRKRHIFMGELNWAQKVQTSQAGECSLFMDSWLRLDMKSVKSLTCSLLQTAAPPAL